MVSVIVVVVAVLIGAWSLSTLLRTRGTPAPGRSTASGPGTAGTVPTTGPGVALGIDTPAANLDNVIAELGRTPAIINRFIGWQGPRGRPIPFPQGFVDQITAMGSLPMITWMPVTPAEAKASGATVSILKEITSGRYDPFLEKWAAAAKGDGHTVYLRLMHEMNGGWYAWGARVDGNTPRDYVAAFRHVVTIFQQAGATNVQFVWCVATASQGTHGSLASYFPGDRYVSWVSMDGYNRNPAQPRSFQEIFAGAYATLTRLSTRPIMIAEMGTAQNPADPSAMASWITDAFLTAIPSQFPRIKAVNYFDSKGKVDYSVDGVPTALAALKAVFADSYYQAPAPR